jgi:uncharacterized protein with GYD domain
MPKYVTMYKYTGAIEGGGPERFAQVQQIAAAGNATILHVYGVLGAYDVVSITEAPDNRTAMKLAAQVGNLIGAKSETMPAIELEDFLQLLTEL